MARQQVVFSPPVLEGMRHFGERLRARRKALGITVTAASEAAGMSRLTWQRLEKGEPHVGSGFLFAAARALGMAVEVGVKPDANAASHELSEAHLPLSIPLAEFPGLRELAWQLGERVEFLTPREALGIYLRNARHLDRGRVGPSERMLMSALERVFGEEIPGA